jgi:hypothetical protein
MGKETEIAPNALKCSEYHYTNKRDPFKSKHLNLLGGLPAT